jgi:hypothetical protein
MLTAHETKAETFQKLWVTVARVPVCGAVLPTFILLTQSFISVGNRGRRVPLPLSISEHVAHDHARDAARAELLF